MGAENRPNIGVTINQPSSIKVEPLRTGAGETVLFDRTKKRQDPTAEISEARALISWAEQTGHIGEVTPDQWKATYARYYTQDDKPLSFSTLEMMWGGRKTITRSALCDRNKRCIEGLQKAKIREERKQYETLRSRKGVRRQIVANARVLGHFSQLPPEEQAFLNSRYPVEGDPKTLRQCADVGVCKDTSSGSYIEKRAIINLVGLEQGRPFSLKSRLCKLLDSLLEKNPNLPIEEITASLRVSSFTAYKYMGELDRVPKINGRIRRRTNRNRALIAQAS